MKATRREKISNIPGYNVARQRTRLLLTPRAVRQQMELDRNLKLTKFDYMLNEAQADVLERWAANEQMLSGRAKGQSWDAGRGGVSDGGPIPDGWMARLNAHSRVKMTLDDYSLEFLEGFTAMQNRSEGALSAAQYGLIMGVPDRNKSDGFLRGVQKVADLLCTKKY